MEETYYWNSSSLTSNWSQNGQVFRSMLATNGIEIDRGIGGNLSENPLERTRKLCLQVSSFMSFHSKDFRSGIKKQQIAHPESQGRGQFLAGAHGRETTCVHWEAAAEREQTRMQRVEEVIPCSLISNPNLLRVLAVFPFHIQMLNWAFGLMVVKKTG